MPATTCHVRFDPPRDVQGSIWFHYPHPEGALQAPEVPAKTGRAMSVGVHPEELRRLSQLAWWRSMDAAALITWGVREMLQESMATGMHRAVLHLRARPPSATRKTPVRLGLDTEEAARLSAMARAHLLRPGQFIFSAVLNRILPPTLNRLAGPEHFSGKLFADGWAERVLRDIRSGGIGPKQAQR